MHNLSWLTHRGIVFACFYMHSLVRSLVNQRWLFGIDALLGFPVDIAATLQKAEMVLDAKKDTHQQQRVKSVDWTQEAFKQLRTV